MRSNDFKRSVKVAAIKRATRDGVLYCEGCGEPIHGPKRVDHKIAAGLNGPATLNNAQVLGRCCYAAKDRNDNRLVKRAIRLEAAHLGVKKRRWRPIPSRPFPKRMKAKPPPSAKIIPRRLTGEDDHE